ncbi:type II secretion system secretin GspD [Phenylobacterium sp.]|jgi:general secretion pathway protein D|uniref:type II secretion system secretin GspD n=1 Tax=Phenylobacterium sp. TaxID=1871053 RepID=UPI002E357640|nr:type II secretion system secretin GspD [Phenylobacterium sp.]HEX3365608.1 type II secretion system secretin GspD [Phenylobacterium sp.]
MAWIAFFPSRAYGSARRPARGGCAALLLMILVALILAPQRVARAAPQPTAAASSDSYTFAFDNAEIPQVIQEILGQLGVAYTIDPTVSGRVSFRIDQRLNREQLLASLEAVLAANNVAMVHNGDALLITPQAKAKSAAEIHIGAQGIRGVGYEVVAVPLGYAQPSEVARAMEAVAAADSVLYSNDKLGLLLLGGSGAQLRAALDTVKVFDQSAFQNARIRWFELSQAQATTVAQELERIAQGAGLTGVNVVALRRLNGVIVFGKSSDALDELSKWVKRLDVPDKAVSSTLWVYRPRFTAADALARTLSGLLGTSGAQSTATAASPTTASQGATATSSASLPPISDSGGGRGSSGDEDVRIGVDRETNTLLFFAAPTRWVSIQRILNEIDRPQRQILIEASIVEVTLGKQFQFGLDWSVLSKNLQVSSVNNSTGTVQASFPGLSVTYISGDIKAALSALGSQTEIEVVSAPKIIALDNHTAHLQVGDQVPVVTQSAVSTATSTAPLVSTVDYRNTGVILNVTPRIAGEDRLVLDVSQEVSTVAKTDSSTINSPTIQQRRFETSLILEDGKAVALGGLISSNRSNNNSGVPYLKDVPFLGALFRSTSHDTSRSELVVLLTARIIKDDASAKRAMDDLAVDLHEIQSRGFLDPKPQ